MKTLSMIAATVLASGFAGSVLAEGPACGAEQDDSWMAPEVVQDKVATMGYTIEDFGISEGNCYALTGLNGQGENVVTYLDPRTGDVVQEDIAQ